MTTIHGFVDLFV